MKRLIVAPLVLAVALVCGCAVTSATDDKSAPPVSSPPLNFPAYSGEKTTLAVLPLGLSQQAARRYPHLLNNSVGMGLHNLITEALYKSNRFRFVEQDENVIKDVFKKQWLAATGAVDQASAVELGRVLGAKKVVYGEVYDYSEGKDEKVAGISKTVTPKIRVGIQVRLVDVETLEYVPASGTATGPDWGEAARVAVDSAVLRLIGQLPH